MSFKKSRKTFKLKDVLFREKWLVVPESSPPSPSPIQETTGDDLPPELLYDIISRVEASAKSWPARRDVVACAGVCSLWRDTVNQIVKTPEQCGMPTFPKSLKQPGLRDEPVQCFIRRDRANSTYRLYLGLSPALSGETTKLLLTAKKVRKPTKTEFLISLTPSGFSRASNTYVGKLRSNFLNTKFSIYDRAIFNSKRVSSPKVKPKVGKISYELNVLRTNGPRRMSCTMNTVPFSSVQKDGNAPTIPGSKFEKGHLLEPLDKKESLVLKNKVPKWHEQLQCWCLDFDSRVNYASVKNFQLAFDEEDDDIMLQFGKMAKDVFMMDYRYPLSAFQAFAICLSSFDTNPACE